MFFHARVLLFPGAWNDEEVDCTLLQETVHEKATGDDL